ncbi:MAG: universal stress protein [Humibacillus sp.]|nr:universal stress protein [Humibacillus sp.]MDN5776828.1 universal stress protein [Humibacillus sp.]
MAGPRTIVVGVDGSKESRTALRWACEEARRRGLDVLAVAVWNVFPITLEPLVGTTPWERIGDSEKMTQETLQAIAGEVAGDFPEVRLDELVLAGRPAEELVTLSADAFILVVGARGHGGFLEMLVGSTSKHVLSHSACTVVVVR